MKNNNRQPSPLDESAFPRTCARCGAVFRNEAEFFARTAAIAHAGSDVRVIHDPDDPGTRGATAVYLEVFRNCACGTTLMERFHSRRDVSEQGLRRRRAFGDMLAMLEQAGCSRDEARHRLLEFIAHL